MIDVILYPPLSKERKIIGFPCAEGDCLPIAELIGNLPAGAGDGRYMAGAGCAESAWEHLMIFRNDRIVSAQAMARDGDTVKLVLSLSGG